MRAIPGRLACLLMTLGALDPVARAACVPDVEATTPTPVARWNRVERCGRSGDDPAWSLDCDVASYRLYVRLVGSGASFERAGDAPCWTVPATGRQTCPSRAAIQRFVDHEAEALEWCVTSVGHDGIESACSNVVAVCMPEIWDGPPQPYD